MKLGDKSIIPYFEAFCIEDDIVWVWLDSFKSIYYRDANEDFKLCAKLPWNESCDSRMFSAMEKVGTKLVLIPCNTSALVFYDVNTKEFTRIFINDDITKCSFMATWRSENFVYAFGFKSLAILRIDVQNEYVEYIDITANIDYENNVPYFRNSIVEKNGELYIPFYNANAILKYSITGSRYDIIRLNKGSAGYGAICEFKEGILLAPRSLTDELLYYNCSNGKVTVFEQDTNLKIDKLHAIGMNVVDEKAVIYILNNEENAEHIYNSTVEIKNGSYSVVRVKDLLTYAYCISDGNLYVYDEYGKEIKKINMQLNLRYSEIINQKFTLNYEMYEDDLGTFIEGVVNSI